MPMYGNPQGTGVVNVAMSNFSKEFVNPELMCFTLAPIVPVTVRSSQYLIHDRSGQRIRPTLRAPGAAPIKIPMAYSLDNYVCQPHAAESELPRESQSTASQLGFQLTKSATKDVMNTIHNRREFELITLYKTSAVNIETPSGTDLWDNPASDPVKQVDALMYQIKKVGVMANTLVLGPDMVKAAKENPAVIEKFKYVEGGVITLAMLAAAFGVPNVKEALAVGADGNDVADFLWKGMAVLSFVQPVASQGDLSGAKTFVDTTQGVDGFEILEFPDAHASKKLDYVSGEMAYDLKITANETLAVITGGTTQQ